MSPTASQITSLKIVYSIVYSSTDQRKHQSSASLAFVRGIHRRPVNSPHKWPVTRKMFPFDDVFMFWKYFQPRLGQSRTGECVQFKHSREYIFVCARAIYLFEHSNCDTIHTRRFRLLSSDILKTNIVCLAKTYTKVLTYWGRVTHMCVRNLTIIGSDNGLSPGRHQAII